MSGFSIVDDFEPIRVLTQLRETTHAELRQVLALAHENKLAQLACGAQSAELLNCKRAVSICTEQREIWSSWLERHGELLAQTTLGVALVVSPNAAADTFFISSKLYAAGVPHQVFEDCDDALAWVIERVEDSDEFLNPQVVLGGVGAFRRAGARE